MPGSSRKVQSGLYRDVEHTGLFESVKYDYEHQNEDANKKELAQAAVEDDIPDQVEEFQRQTGNLEVYKYYFQSIGFLPMLIFTLFVSVNVFSGSFSSMRMVAFRTIVGANSIQRYG